MPFNPELTPHEISRQLYFDNGGRILYIHLDGFGEQYAAGNPTESIWKEELIALYRQRIAVETNATVLAGITDNLRYHGATGIKEILLERYDKGETPDKIATAYAYWKGLNEEVGAKLLTELYLTVDEQSRTEIRSHFNYMWGSSAVREFVIQRISEMNTIHIEEIHQLLKTWNALQPSLFDHTDLIETLCNSNKNDQEYFQSSKRIVEFLKNQEQKV